jgi:general secretion pathway protein C
MELAKNLAQWRDQSPEQWIARANRILPPVVVAVLVILIAMQAASLTLRLLESRATQATVPTAMPVTGSGTRNARSTSLVALADWRPFGEPPSVNPQAIPAEVLLDAPETSLPLKLHSTLQVQDLPERGSLVIPEAGAAAISSGRGQQKVYRTGDAIDDASGAKLHSIFTDRVLLDRNGRLETLFYPPIETTSNAPARPDPGIAAAPQRTAADADEPAARSSLLDSMSNVAATFGQHMQIAAQVENGQTIGYRLQPRGESQVFTQLGLEPGDVMTAVNGISLADIRNTSQIWQALAQAPQASVTIRRNGVDQAMTINMSQLERLSQSLQ